MVGFAELVVRRLPICVILLVIVDDCVTSLRKGSHQNTRNSKGGKNFAARHDKNQSPS